MRIKWFFAHIVPRIHWSTYGRDGKRWLCIWRQWLWFCYDVTEVRVMGEHGG